MTPPLVDLRAAYHFARGVARSRTDPLPGHRLVWVRDGAHGMVTLVASGDAFAVVGRHPHATIVLPDEETVAHRHLLVRSIALPSGGVALRVLDLHTDLGFGLPDGSRHTSIFAEGPIAVSVGANALVALPNESDLPLEMPAPSVEAPPHLREQLEAYANAMSPYRQNARPMTRASRITLMPRPVMIGEPLPPDLARLTSGGRYMLTLARAGRVASVALSADDVVRGVLIGRSGKCFSESLRRITDVSTSRAHVLILREGAVVWAYDLASTQGTFVGDERVRRVALHDAGGGVTLARGANAVRVMWIATGA